MSQPLDRLKQLEEFTLADLEAVRLILSGDSVIDWHRVDFADTDEIREFLIAQEIRPDEPPDQARMEAVKNEAVGFLRRQFEYPIPKPVERATVPELLMLASGRGHRQTCACTILKCMHIIHHLDGRELLFMLPLSDQEVFHIVEEKVYRVIGSMLAGGFPIVEFVGGRKNKDSLYTKLLSKQETTAAAIYDKLRFRIVTRSGDDIFPVMQYLSKRLFPFSYVVPQQSINSMFAFRSYCGRNSHLAELYAQMQGPAEVDFTPSDNSFSAETYRVLHFVVDMPVRLPRRILERAPPSAWPLGGVIFVICEFQLVDRNTDGANELGEASHAKYKERQKKAVMRRLHLGTRDPRLPGFTREIRAANDAGAEAASDRLPPEVTPAMRPTTIPPPAPDDAADWAPVPAAAAPPPTRPASPSTPPRGASAPPPRGASAPPPRGASAPPPRGASAPPPRGASFPAPPRVPSIPPPPRAPAFGPAARASTPRPAAAPPHPPESSRAPDPPAPSTRLGGSRRRRRRAAKKKA